MVKRLLIGIFLLSMVFVYGCTGGVLVLMFRSGCWWDRPEYLAPSVPVNGAIEYF